MSFPEHHFGPFSGVVFICKVWKFQDIWWMTHTGNTFAGNLVDVAIIWKYVSFRTPQSSFMWKQPNTIYDQTGFYDDSFFTYQYNIQFLTSKFVRELHEWACLMVDDRFCAGTFCHRFLHNVMYLWCSQC